MIRVSALYAHRPGARFDFDYYRERHFPMVMELMQEYGMQRYEIERGLEMADGGPPRYTAIGTIWFEDMERLQAGLARHGATILADIPNYTDLHCDLQFGSVS